MTDLMRYIYVDMNSYFASVEQHLEPALIGKPVAVTPMASEYTCCIAASYEAKRLGIKVGTPVREARKICPDITFKEARHDVYVDFHHQIKAAIDAIRPVTGTHSVDEFSCRLIGPDQDLEMALEFSRQIRSNINSSIGPALRCSIGIGPSLLLSKLAGELEKPEGLQWLGPSNMPNKINHLALRDIPGISRGIERRLFAANILKTSDLYNLPPKHARKLWRSVEGERFLLALLGHDIVAPVHQRRSLGHSQVLASENRNSEGARLVARRLLIKAATRLRRDQFYATRLTISVKDHINGRLERSARFPQTQDSFDMLKTFALLWHSMTPSHLTQPRGVSVTLSDLVEENAHSNDLFAHQDDLSTPPKDNLSKHASRKHISTLVDELNQKYGRDSLIYGEKPKSTVKYTGAKIAFNRVPETREFCD